MKHRFYALIFVWVLVAGCGRTRPGLRSPTIVDAHPVVEPSTSVDATAMVDATSMGDTTSDAGAPYPLVDGGQGRPVIDPQYVWHNFNGLLEGTWLIGWYGGENHFSWIRFPPTSGNMFDNAVEVLSTSDVSFNQPYWECSGAGTWNSTARPATVDLAMPAGCAREILIFDSFRPVPGLPGAILEADIRTCRGSQCNGPSSTKLVGLKFPDSYCDGALTACGKPF